MKLIILSCIIIFFSIYAKARSIGETEITAQDGIEVFQDEKYYLLKENVKIKSDNFNLFADNIKIYFEKDLYDIVIIEAFTNVKLVSNENNINALGNELTYSVKNEKIIVKGIDSELITENVEMYSDGSIMVNNLDGDFYLKGKNSKLISESITILGEEIVGEFSPNTATKEIQILNVYDKKQAYIESDTTEMFAKKINYNHNTSIIELEDSVKIISDGEIITGDYGTLDRKTNSYKIKSKNSNKVKVIISNTDE